MVTERDLASAVYPEKPLHEPYTMRTVVRGRLRCDHPSQRHLGRGWLACNLCGEHTYEEA